MKNERRGRRLVCGLVATTLVLQACSTIQETEANAQKAREQTRRILDERTAQGAPAGVTRLAGPRIAGREIKLVKKEALPDIFDAEIGYASHGTQRLSEVLEELGARTGMAISSTEIASMPRTGQAAQASAGSEQPITAYVQVEFSGKVRSLFDDLAQRAGASWRYVKSTNSVQFYRFETRTYPMHLPSGAKSLQAAISLSSTSLSSGGGSGSAGGATGAGGSSGGAGGGGNVSVTQSQVIDPWTSIMASVQAILGASQDTTATGRAVPALAAGASGAAPAAASKLSASGLDGFATAAPELGIVTVTARPLSQARIAALLHSINQRFARNLLIDVTIYNVSMTKEETAGVSMDLVYRRLNGNGVGVAGAAPLQPANGQPGRITLSFSDPASRLAGSRMVAEALQSVGNVALYKKGQFMAINGQPSPFQVVDDEEYNTSVSATQTANVGTQLATQKAVLTTGLTGNVLPLILGDNRILLQYQMEISAVSNMNPAVVNGILTYSPKRSRQSFQQQAFLKDGDAIVLFGYDSGGDEAAGQVSLSGGSKRGRGDRTMSVIVMQVFGGQKNG
ncbi:Type II secretory pathway component PulD-like protein [Paracidovorax citrulli]|uniref:Type II secretory pathway component PulD-like protein n=2 Tax=Paracidovorax citrulli TaxID=80869 RepID=A0ABY9AWM3_PARCI|nr:secretin N-terminal domain-containing protein [Paracidovorax citrulli]UMT83240.1 Type II secretory pathway component PulD-like protein [Paracidovorax citrulli]WIY31561.1 Type II secretory pathway component PulD-like protein [Paracidovorax citrulli]WIY40838.1 Type II secretory pathway component PulD-like protein [Paracidovorax citrulli]WIY41928.1 Type II secretory pathway component PulD-like protein [Paracidovorax citrulli]WIY51185.1 Type II secretory pathway component PulD-like protein [Par